MNKIVFLSIIYSCLANLAMAQDVHFSQFYHSPMQLNPAQIGVFKGAARGTINYRSQWASILENNPYRTIAASYESKLQVSRDDYMGLSVDFLSDQAGPSHFSQFNGHLGGSYQKKVSGGGRGSRYRRNRSDQYIVAGFQVGAGQFSVNTADLWYSTQYDPNRVSVNYNAPSGEQTGPLNSNLYADLNAGMMWYSIFDDNKSVYVGGAINHANAPDIRFGNSLNGSILKWRFVGQIGAELPLTRELSILPAFVLQNQGVSQQFLTGFNIRYTAQDWREVALRAGLWSRFANRLDKGKAMDALIVTSILEMEKLNIGLSYDINVSKLTPSTNYRGAFEVVIQYVQPERRRRNKVICPRF
jgi:type IX secretion system PorP/SprF family membrane protein